MKRIRIYVPVEFDTNQVTEGTPIDQARQAVDLINGTLQREPYGLGAALIPPRSFKRVTLIDDQGQEVAY